MSKLQKELDAATKATAAKDLTQLHYNTRHKLERDAGLAPLRHPVEPPTPLPNTEDK